MALNKLAIHIQGTRPDDHEIQLGEAFIKKWKIPPRLPIMLQFGSARREVRVEPVKGLSAMRISESLANRLGLHHGAVLCIKYRPMDRTLRIGPLIGVLVSRVSRKAPQLPFGATTEFCKELSEACRIYGGYVYFFTPNDITTGASTVNGWIYHGGWSKRPVPVPDVLYNRLTSRKLENKPIVQQFVKDVKQRHRGYVFNEKYLDKTDVFQALQREQGLANLLPESHLAKSYAILQGMCRKYGIVFLKPINGSLGKGIIKIVRNPTSGYTVYFTSLNGMRKQTFASTKELYSSIAGKLRARPHQIQQGIRLIEIGGRPVDFRVLVQRNQQGEWDVTSIVGRIAPNHTFVSNLARGGTLCTVKDALARSNLSAAGKKTALLKLKQAALKIAKGIERQISGHYAELGVDLGLDATGRVWLMEVNTKPSKDDAKPASVQNKIRPSVRKLLEYCRYLANL